MKKIPVIVKYGNGTYQARVIGRGDYKCTCTGGVELAAEALAGKFYGPKATVRKAGPEDRFPESQWYPMRLNARGLRQIQSEMTHIIGV